MEIYFSSDFIRKLKIIKNRDRNRYEKIEERLRWFKLNQDDSRLKLHKLTGELKSCWAIWVERNFRLTFYISKNDVVFFDLGTHDQVYKKK